MNYKRSVSFLLAVIIFCCAGRISAQRPLDRIRGMGNIGGGGGGADSLAHRSGYEDSITITVRYLDSSRYRKMDSTITDFSKQFPIPADHIFLGNTGSAARSIIFRPNMTAGWDPGFHSFDIYQGTVPETKFYSTTRPYSELVYIIGARAEQIIRVLHTQNISPDWNAAFQFRLINAPGLLRSQNTNHSNLRLNTTYQSKNRRYHAFFVYMNNRIEAGENGGIRTDEDYLANSLSYSDRSLIPVQLGNSIPAGRSVFSTNVITGTKYSNRHVMFRHQYDLGIKDSVVTDSTVIRLFYPKIRIEHTARISSYNYGFADLRPDIRNDSAFYASYGFTPDQLTNTISIVDKWSELFNDLSVYQFPDSKNSQQFFKAGASIQTLKGTFTNETRSLYNVILHGEYRNKTRNQKWDIEATGQLYSTGFNAGDYNAYISLRRFISKKIGYLQGGFQNVNRTPSFVFDNSSSFNKFTRTTVPSFNKENVTNIFASIEQPLLNLQLTGHYYLISNYTYFSSFTQPAQYSSLFNLLQVGAIKRFRLGKRWRLDSEVTVQQKAGAAPLNIPLLYTRNNLYFQGSLGFKNLLLLFGTEIRYHTPYKADTYSPVLGQFVYQDTTTIRLKAPHITAFLHFRIKTFTTYVRAENLNTVSLRDGFGFTNNNFAAPNYIYPGLLIRIGIVWGFVN
ncbi:MAG: hypothetical protein H7Y03_13935 [Chitinophagaceae bacterium]|nr:hypothetical protein [Chitinophagaceae bacterium]